MDNTVETSDGALEQPKDAGPGEEGEITRWLMVIQLADKNERDWNGNANDAIKRYRHERRRADKKESVKSDWQFNIFWANVDVMRPHLYGATPKADVRRRYRDQDPAAKAAAEILERALDYHIDTTDFDGEMANVILDYLIPSRGVARVRFEPVTEPQIGPDGQPMADESGEPMEKLTGARTYIERVAWDRFKRGPGITWGEVPWQAYEWQLTKEEVKKKFPSFDGEVDYDVTMEGVSEDRAKVEPNVFKRVRVYEIWDKSAKEILWLAPSCKTQFLLREGDKLQLEGFFDTPRPLYAVESGTSLVPVVEYDMYRAQAKELDNVTYRINKLIATMKQRGIYDSTVTELKTLMAASDNEMIPVANSNAAMAAGGLEKAIWMMPIDVAANVLKELYLQREQVKATIYELTGISDILRGDSDPTETLGAQKLKAQTGGKRIQRRQRDVQRFIRDLLRKMAEIISQNYTPELLTAMTGVKLPTAEQKAQAQFAIQQAQATQQPVPPDAQQALTSPTWEEVMQILKSDVLRSYRVDIETDSTISADQEADREQITALIEGIGGFVRDVGPAVQTGALSQETSKKILVACLRYFKMGRIVEDALEDDMERPMPQKPDPEAQKAQAQAQLEQAKAQVQMQLEQFKAQNTLKLEQAKAQIQSQHDQQRMQSDAALAHSEQQSQAQQDLLSQRAEVERDRQQMQLQHEADIKRMMLEHQMEMEKIQAENEAKLEQIKAQGNQRKDSDNAGY